MGSMTVRQFLCLVAGWYQHQATVLPLLFVAGMLTHNVYPIANQSPISYCCLTQLGTITVEEA
jgi:hypothetical protein